MHVCSLGMNLGDHTQLLWSHFPELLPLCHLSRVFSFPGLFFSVLQSERWGFGYPTLPYTSATVPGPSKGQRGRENNETGPILLQPQPHQSERKVLLLQNFGSCKLPLPPSWDCLETGVQWNEEKQKRIFAQYYILHFLPLELKLEGFSRCSFCALVPISTSRLGCIEFRLRDNNGKNDKLTTGLVVL